MKRDDVDDGNDPITVKSAAGMYNDYLPQSPQKQNQNSMASLNTLL
jgi:hypothetical protein